MINLQLESRQKEFFGVVCLHDFYTDLVTRDLEIEPSQETTEILRNFNLVFKPMAFGFLVLYNPSYSLGRLKDFPFRKKLTFYIRNRNPLFSNFSNIDFSPEGHIFHYNNINSETRQIPFEVPREIFYYFKQLNVSDVNKKVLHLPKHDLLPVRPSKFNMVFPETDGKAGGIAYKDLVVKDDFGQTETSDGKKYKKALGDVLKREIEMRVYQELKTQNLMDLPASQLDKKAEEIRNKMAGELENETQSNIQVDLKSVAPSKFVIGKGKYGEEAVYVTDEPSSRYFGVIEISLDTEKDALLNRKTDDTEDLVNPQMYFIHFESRQTYWRYFFLNYKNSKVSPKQIREENEDITFTNMQEGMLENFGTPAVISVSEKPIALKDKPKEILFLERMNGIRSMKEMRLPTPSPNMVKPVREEGGTKIYSDIFVYI